MDRTTRRKELHDLADRLQSDVRSYEGKFTFPIEHIIGCLRDDGLQARHSLTDALERYRGKLGEPAENAVWLYFESPAWTWQELCGQSGWLVFAKEPPREIAFFLEVMS